MQKLKETFRLWIIVYVLITSILYGLHTVLLPLPIWLRSLVLSGLMVFVMQYIVFPVLQKLSNKPKITPAVKAEESPQV